MSLYDLVQITWLHPFSFYLSRYTSEADTFSVVWPWRRDSMRSTECLPSQILHWVFFFLHVSSMQSFHTRVPHQGTPKVHALIRTQTATEAPEGMDMFSGAATKPIYICPVSSSCSPHVTSCYVGALIVVSPRLCCLLLSPFWFCFPWHKVLGCLFPTVSSNVCLQTFPPPYFLYFLSDQRKESVILFSGSNEINIFFSLTNPTPACCGELFTSRWCPSVASP